MIRTGQTDPVEQEAELRERLAGSRFGDCRWVASIGSTNAELSAQVAASGAEQTEPIEQVLLTDHQSAGRGRRGRSWVAPPGSSLMLSVLVDASHGAVGKHGPQAAVTALALAASDSCAAVAGVRPMLKWPNDLVIGDKKIAGVLAEMPTGMRWLIIGMGLNVAWPAELPEDLAASATTLGLERVSTTHGAEDDIGAEPVDRVELAARVLRGFEGWLATDVSSLMAAYRDRSATLGRRVRVERTDGFVTGTAVEVLDDGRLTVSTSDGLVTVEVGDVVHLRSSD